METATQAYHKSCVLLVSLRSFRQGAETVCVFVAVSSHVDSHPVYDIVIDSGRPIVCFYAG